MSLQSEIDKWAKSPAGKKKIEKEQKRAMAEGREFGRTVRGPVRTPEFYAKAMTEILQDKVAGIRSKTTGEAYLDHISYRASKDGAEVFFEPDEMERPSLDPKYNVVRGIAIENIAVLINNGYRAAGAVHGVDRHKNERWSLLTRDGLHFMQEAVDEFNRRFDGEVYADLDSKYW